MTQRLYSVLDKKAKHVVSVFPSITDETAERSFYHLLTAPEQTVYTLSPEDFELVFVGDLDGDGKLVDPLAAGKVIRRGNEYSRPILDGERLKRADFLAALSHAESRKESIDVPGDTE